MNTTPTRVPLQQGSIRHHLRPIALVGAAGALVLAGCGTTEIDPKKVEKSIHESVATAGNQLASASCPSGVSAKKGGSFDCKFRLTDGRHGTVTILQTSDKGDIHIAPSAYHVQ